MKANFTLFDPIQIEGKCAVITGEDTDVKATQFRGSDETPAGSLHKDHVRIADDWPPERRRGVQNSKRDEGTTFIVPHVVVAEQWLCLLLGMICGVCGLFMKYNQDSPFAYIRWLGPAHEPILRFTAIACFIVGAVLIRCGLATPDQSLVSIDQKPLRSVRANLAPASNRFYAWGPILGFGLTWKGEDHHQRRHI
jgi:hypothetical protein